MRRYIGHTFSIVREADSVNLFELKDLMLEKAREYSGSFNDVAERYNSLIQNRMGIEISGPEASVRISTSDEGRDVFTLSLFCPTEQAVNIEQKLTRDFMTAWYALREENALKFLPAGDQGGKDRGAEAVSKA